MSCSDCSDMAYFVCEFVDEILDDIDYEVTQADIAHHVESCPECQELARAERQFRAIVARKCCETAPSQLRVQIEQMISVRRIEIMVGEQSNVPCDC